MTRSNWNGLTITYDANGNMLSGGGNTFTWNARNQVATLNGVSLQYDAFGRRIKSAVGTSFFYDGANAVQELSGTTVTANLLSGGVDEVFSRTDSGGAFTQLKDALGSAIALVDASGNVQTSYTYDPFGNTSVTGANNANEFQYTGRENEGNGLYFYRARYYSPLLGRFISEDPLGFSGSGPNFYAYAGDDPIDFEDPFGLSTAVLDPITTTGRRVAPWLVRFCVANPEVCALPVAAGAVGGIAYERIQLEHALDALNNASSGELQSVHQWNLAVRLHPPARPLAGRYTGGGGDGGCYTDEDVADAQQMYPKKAGKPEAHHIIPQYLGGLQDGLTETMDGAYHQLITNAFRRRWPYGSRKPTPQQLQQLLDEVYSEHPWKKCK